MKLSTMTLPTGEFVFILADAPRMMNDVTRAKLKRFADSAGAAGMFISDVPIEFEDSMIDENAKRAGSSDDRTDVESFDGELSVSSPELIDLATGKFGPAEPTLFKPGDRVVCHGRSEYDTNIEGVHGRLRDKSGAHPDCWNVQLDHSVTSPLGGSILVVVVKPEQLEREVVVAQSPAKPVSEVSRG